MENASKNYGAMHTHTQIKIHELFLALPLSNVSIQFPAIYLLFAFIDANSVRNSTRHICVEVFGAFMLWNRSNGFGFFSFCFWAHSTTIICCKMKNDFWKTYTERTNGQWKNNELFVRRLCTTTEPYHMANEIKNINYGIAIIFFCSKKATTTKENTITLIPLSTR